MKQWQEAAADLLKRFQLDGWVEIIHTGHSWEGFRVIIAPYDFEDGRHDRAELLSKEIPIEFILAIRKLFPRSTPLFVRGLVTHSETKEAWANLAQMYEDTLD